MGYEYAKEFLSDYDQHARDSDYFKNAENEFYDKGVLPALESFVYFIDDPNIMEDLDNVTTYTFNKYRHALPKLMKNVSCKSQFCQEVLADHIFTKSPAMIF